MIGRLAGLLCLVLLAACAVPPAPAPAPERVLVRPDGLPTPEVAADNFVTVIDRVEPKAEATCKRIRRDDNCDFRIFVDNDPRLPPNAFQAEDRSGHPVIVFSIALIAMARNKDELAFILGHESAHHTLGHIDRSRTLAEAGAQAAALQAQSRGAGRTEIDLARRIGGAVNARRYSKTFELEADALGTRIAYAAGFDPIRGAEYFSRTPDPGNRFLGTHPPNAERIAQVRRIVALLRAGR